MARTRRIARLALALCLGLFTGVPSIEAQSALDRSPNLTGGWTAEPGVIQFNLLHRFDVSPAPARKVVNSPTFLVGYGLSDRIMVAFNYASNSDLEPNYPNEWEFFGRWLAFDQEDGGPADLSVQAGYNLATESVDGEVLLGRSFGPARLFAGGRAFSEGPGSDEARYAAAGGAVVQLLDGVAASGDVAGLLDPEDDEEPAWGFGLQLAVPYTPHSVSFHFSNVNTATLAGSSVGSGTNRWGFEYTIPVTVRRYLPTDRADTGSAGGTAMGGGGDMADEAAMDAAPVMESDTVVVRIEDFEYDMPDLEIRPGTTVEWVNEGVVQHTVTSDDELFDSDLIEPEGRWSYTFEESGEYAYHCTPHPFMQARVIVRGGRP